MKKCYVVSRPVNHFDKDYGTFVCGVFSTMKKVKSYIAKEVDEMYKDGYWKDYFNGSWSEKEVKDSLSSDFNINHMSIR